MSVPARKKSRSAVRRRRSHHGLKQMNLDNCNNCEASVQAHRACASCGHYNGRQVVEKDKEIERIVKQASTPSKAESKSKDKAPAEESQESKTKEEEKAS